MKFTSAIFFCVLATSAFGNVMRASYAGNAGNTAGQPMQPVSAPANTAPAPAPYTAPAATAHDEKCWMETKKCCWVEKEDGYECRDNYDMKTATCNKKYKFDRKCDKAEKHGQLERPSGRVDYSRCEKVHYDPNYGPHVIGYPSGVSETYHSKKLPSTPYKVEAKPYAPYVAPAPATNYEQDVANNNGYLAQAPARGY